MALDKNIKINTSSNINFVMNGKQIKSLDDLPSGISSIAKLMFGGTAIKCQNQGLNKVIQSLYNNPEVKKAIQNKSLKIDPFNKTFSYNGKEIKSLEDIPEPFKSIASKVLTDENNNQVPDFIEAQIQKKTLNSALEKQEPIKANIPLKTPEHSYKPLNVAGNPLNKLQAVLLIITVLIVLFYIFANA
ncbi:hypothetical protein GW755_01000 [bacterium]|nr:hypothetical protein [bacterium]